MVVTSHRHDNAGVAALFRGVGFVPWELEGFAVKPGEVYLRLPDELVYNRTRKRTTWGVKKQRPRPPEEWVRVPAPDLQIVPNKLWEAAHERLRQAQATYLAGTRGEDWGRPVNGVDSKYLLRWKHAYTESTAWPAARILLWVHDQPFARR
jgi:Recombinase